jgi:hypothetical protein
VWDSGFSVADFVAVHSCEGSGGITPRFPHTPGASGLSKRECKEPTRLFAIFACPKHYEFQLMEGPFTYEPG